MNLSAVTPDMAPVLAQLHASAFDSPWGEAALRDVLAGPGAFGLLAQGEAPLGMILARVVAGEGEILTVAVPPAGRRRGVGRALVAAVVALMRQAGAQALFLEVAVDNAGAIGLYESQEFSRAGVRKGYYDRGRAPPVDALVLRLDLNSQPA